MSEGKLRAHALRDVAGQMCVIGSIFRGIFLGMFFVFMPLVVAAGPEITAIVSFVGVVTIAGIGHWKAVKAGALVEFLGTTPAGIALRRNVRHVSWLVFVPLSASLAFPLVVLFGVEVGIELFLYLQVIAPWVSLLVPLLFIQMVLIRLKRMTTEHQHQFAW